MGNKLLFYGVTMDDREILIDLRPKHNEWLVDNIIGYLNPIQSIETGEQIGMAKAKKVARYFYIFFCLKLILFSSSFIFLTQIFYAIYNFYIYISIFVSIYIIFYLYILL